MGKQTIIESVKEWLAGICWHLFLWLNNLTENEYFRQIKEQELRTDDSRPLDSLVMWQKVLPLLQEIKAEIEYWHMDYLEDDKANGWQRVHKKIDIFIAELLST